MREDPHQYGGRQLLVCEKTLISRGEDSCQYAGRRSLVWRNTVVSVREDAHQQLLVCGKTLISMEEDSCQYAGRPLLVWRKTVVSMQEGPHQYGGRQNICILIKGKTGEDTNRAEFHPSMTYVPEYYRSKPLQGMQRYPYLCY